MTGQTQQNSGSEQPGIARLPIPDSRGPNAHDAFRSPLGDGQNAVHNYFLRNLNDERSGRYTPGENSADPAVTPDRGQPLTAVETNPVPAPQQQQQVTSPQSGVQPTAPAEQPFLPIDQPIADSQQMLEQPQGVVDEAGLEIDGERYTESRIRQMLSDLDEGTMRLEDYTRKTQLLSRVRQESDALNTDLIDARAAVDRQAQVILEVVEGNLRQYEQVNVTQLTQEQHAQYVQAYEQAKRGAEALRAAFAKADQDYNENYDRAFKRMSESTRQMLRWHEPRWDNEGTFYGQLRTFVLEQGLMDQKTFDRENDFLKIVGLISMMDRHTLPETIQETIDNPRPSERQQNLPQRDAGGRFTNNLAATTNAVLSSRNARMDGSFQAMKMAQMEDERRRGVHAQR